MKIRKPFSSLLRTFRDGSGMVVRIVGKIPLGDLIYHRLYIRDELLTDINVVLKNVIPLVLSFIFANFAPE